MKIYQNPNQEDLKKILTRPFLEQVDLNTIVEGIFDQVALNGDLALKQLTQKFDKAELKNLEVTEQEINSACNQLDDSLKKAIKEAYRNIYLFHEKQIEAPIKIETTPGVICWRKSVGIEKVGLYIPGGSAPLFSTILMLAIPAKIAECKEIVLCTPCDLEGKVNPAILFTAKLCGISRIFKLGGIQAIAAMTLGTESVPAVYKIFGPGNQYVTAAKLYAQKFKVAIDMPAGPSEVMLVCDENANEKYVASDLLAQAEHGADSQVILVCTNFEKAQQIKQELEIQLEKLPRKAQASGALENSAAIVTSKENVIPIVNSYAPEHLILNTSYNDNLIDKISNAGSVFIGQYTPESAGDYASGTNHTLPTNGYANQYSGVSVDSFVKKITFQEISKEGLLNLGKTIEIMAEAEGLEAHKNAVSIRLKDL
jgi:histidinol dehydrogenase